MSTAHEDILVDGDPIASLGANRVLSHGKAGAQMGPLSHLQDERARLAALEWHHFDVRRLGSTIGAELVGLDLSRDLADDVIFEIARALDDYKVVFFRDQVLTSEQHAAFAKRFGELEIHPFIPSNTGIPELVRFEKSAEVGGYENQWHHDVTWRECPSRGAVLHALSVPESGGDTLFADMYAAYEGLSDDWKARLDGMTASHDYLHAFGAFVPEGQREETRAKYPRVRHPVVCTHPSTGRKHLYVNRIFTDVIDGLPDADSAAAIDFLARQAETPEYQCRFHWEPGSVAFWDNRAVQHYAASDYWPDVRVMERASIVGDRPAA